MIIKCFQIFTRLSPELTNEIFAHLIEHERPIYKAMIQNLATRRKLRPVFIERKARDERHIWLKQALSVKSADDIASQLLQIWLLGAHRQMICDFLNLLGIKHDGQGVVDNLPAEPRREAITDTITKLLENHPPEVVAVYLYTFQAMDATGWSALDEILATDGRLALKPTQ